MSPTVSRPIRSASASSTQSARPIKVWSSHQPITEDPEELSDPISPELPSRPEFFRRKSTTFAVPGLTHEVPDDALTTYDIPESFWNKFIAALNAALSEFPKWKDPNSVRRRRGLSFSEGDQEVVCFGSHEPSQKTQAEEVLKWWNDDYFNEKGCEVELNFSAPENEDNNIFGFDAKPTLSFTAIQ